MAIYKVENYLMLSEYENNLIQQSSTSTSERKSRKSSIFHQLSQTFNARYGHKSGPLDPTHLATNSNISHGKRLSSPHRAFKECCESVTKKVQVQENTEAEGMV